MSRNCEDILVFILMSTPLFCLLIPYMGNREVCLEYCTGIRSNCLLQLRVDFDACECDWRVKKIARLFGLFACRPRDARPLLWDCRPRVTGLLALDKLSKVLPSKIVLDLTHFRSGFGVKISLAPLTQYAPPPPGVIEIIFLSPVRPRGLPKKKSVFGRPLSDFIQPPRSFPV